MVNRSRARVRRPRCYVRAERREGDRDPSLLPPGKAATRGPTACSGAFRLRRELASPPVRAILAASGDSAGSRCELLWSLSSAAGCTGRASGAGLGAVQSFPTRVPTLSSPACFGEGTKPWVRNATQQPGCPATPSLLVANTVFLLRFLIIACLLISRSPPTECLGTLVCCRFVRTLTSLRGSSCWVSRVGVWGELGNLVGSFLNSLYFDPSSYFSRHWWSY